MKLVNYDERTLILQNLRPVTKQVNNTYTKAQYRILLQIPLHRITDSASNGSVFPVVTEHFSASSDHAFL